MKSFLEVTNPTYEGVKLDLPKPTYVSEMTVSPNYQQKGTFNPYYTLKVDDDIINQLVRKVEIQMCGNSKGRRNLYIR